MWEAVWGTQQKKGPGRGNNAAPGHGRGTASKLALEEPSGGIKEVRAACEDQITEGLVVQ